jgi:hypothetical protein
MRLFNVISRIFGERSARTSRIDALEREPTSYFLVVFDAKRGVLVSQEQIFEPRAAMDAFAEAERSHKDERDLQVVMFTADSIETVHATHPHYFRGPTAPSTDPFGLKPVATAH